MADPSVAQSLEADMRRVIDPVMTQFGPYRGCVTTREKVALGFDEMAANSKEWMVDPMDGRLCRRGGSSILYDSNSTPSGLLESKWGARAQSFLALRSPSFTAGGESPGFLLGDEADKEGTYYFRSINGNGTNHQLMDEYGSTHYSHTASTEPHMKIVPLASESTGGYLRWINATQRKYAATGRIALETDLAIYFTGDKTTPSVWNKRFNDATNSGTEKNRYFPWLLYKPLYAPLTSVPGAVASGAWKDGYTFYEAWIFEYEDGSWSSSFDVNPGQTTPAYGGLVVIGSIGGSNHYPYRTITGIPIGPKMPIPVRRRIGLRSLVQTNRTAATDPITVDPFKLYPFCVIEDNTTTSYNDYAASDTNLAADDRVRSDHISPPRCQGVVACDGRAILFGAVRPNPSAIIIAPLGDGLRQATPANPALNAQDDGAIYGTIYYHVWCDGTTLKLKKTTGGVTVTQSYTLANYTLGSLVAAINETVDATNIDSWAAQLVDDEIDPGTPATKLRASTDTGDDAGDQAPVDSTTTNMRAYGPTYPIVLYLTEAYLATFPTDYTVALMSSASPGGPRSAFSAFFDSDANWKAPASSKVGDLLNVHPITGAGGVVAIFVYENAVCALRNTVSGGSGSDADYVLVELDGIDGSCGWRASSAGPGFVAVLGAKRGLRVFDGTPGGIIFPASDDMYDPEPPPGCLAGDWSASIAADQNTTTQRGNPYTEVKVIGNRIRVRYRSTSSNAYCDRGTDYWYRQGHNAGGFAALLRQKSDGLPATYGWSAPIQPQRYGVFGQFIDANGRHTVGWDERNAGSAGDGRIDEYDTGSTDNGTAFTSEAWTNAIVADPWETVGIKQADPEYRKNGSGLTIDLYVDLDEATSKETLTLRTTGTNVLARERHKLTPGSHSAGKAFAVQAKVSDDGSASGAVDVRRIPIKLVRSSAETRYP